MIPQSPIHAAIGFIAEEGRSARGKLERFLNRIGFKPVEIQSARIPCYSHRMQPWQRISGCQICLVGDAAAQVKVTTVGGLVTGLRGAKAAASAILGRRDYAKELRSLRRELGRHLLIRTALKRFQSADYDRLLGLLNQDAIHLWEDTIATGQQRALSNHSGSASTSELRCTVNRPNLATFIERQGPYPT